MKKRLLALLLAAVMALPTSITAFAAETATTLENQVLDLAFENNLNDDSGKGNNGTIHGTATYVDGVVGKALQFNGSTYVDLGKSTDLQPENLTVSFWLKPNSTMTGEQLITWNKNEWHTDGWYVSCLNDNVPLAISIGPAESGGQPYQIQVADNRAAFFPVGEWTHIVITYNKTTKDVKVYRNAVECSTSIAYSISGAATGVLGSDASMQKSLGWNGPVHNTPSLKAALDEYQLYNDVATVEEVIALYQAGGGSYDKKAIAQADLDALSIPASVRSNMSLPTTGASGSVITWKSNNTAVLTADGKVTRPAVGKDDVTVTLTATAVFAGGEAVTKNYTVVVKALTEETTDISLEPNSVMGNVTLVDDYLDNAYTKEVEYLLSMDSEKFLYNFYKVAGLTPTTSSGYGGWERTGQSNFRGHTFGHYMSALSMCYLSSDDEDIKADLMAEMVEAVEGLKKCQEAYAAKYPDHAGYISAFPQGVLRRVDGVASPTSDDSSVLVPYYNLHKVLAGLIDIAKNAGDAYVQQTALEVAEGFGEFLYNRMLKLTNKNAMLSIEYGGINEALYELYRITGNDHYKEAAQYFDETSFFQQLANGQDVLNGKHANTQIPKLTGAVKRYTVLTENDAYYDALTTAEKNGLDMYLKAGENFFDMVVNDHTYVTGGNSQSEHFHAAGAIGADATTSEYGAALTCETCNTHNMLKLAKALFEVTKDKKYMDYYENTYINAILSSQNPETGTTMYFQPMAPGYNKVFNRPHDEFWCCTGTGMENFSKLGDNIYMTDENSVYVHMFFSSEYTDAANNLVLTQEANMPNEDTITIEVAAATGKEVKEGTVLKLRKPDWLAGEAEIKVNGKAIELNEQAGYYVVEVKAGDKITYKMPMTVVVYDMPDMPNLVAFKYGPIVLSCALSTNNIEASQANGILVRVGTFDPTVRTGILMEGNYKDIEDWKADIEENLVRIEDSEDGQVQFKLNNTDADDELIYTPHYMRYKERYGLYMYLEGKDSELAQQRILAEKEALREAEMSIDALHMFDDNNSEKAKNVQSSSDSGVGTHEGKTYRHADQGGWFSYDLAIDKEAEKNYLNLTFYSGDRNRNYNILINDEVVETYRYADAPSGNQFYVHTLEIPAKFINAAEDGKITLKFAGNGNGNFVGGVFGISITSGAVYDNNPNLKALSFDKGTLSEKFDGNVTEYVLTVPADTDSVNMTATPNKPSGLVYINGILFDDTQPRAIDLVEGDTYIRLMAKAQDHETSKTYNITILKEGATARPRIIAHFDFDDEETGFTNGYAFAKGTYTLADHDGGKALQLNGRNQFLEVTKEAGSSILTGLSEMTVSFQVKPTSSATNWAFYAAPNANTQSYPYEHYLGVLINGNNILAERYNNNGTRPSNASVDRTLNDWTTITVVHTETDTTIYVNGTQAAKQSSAYDLRDILGDESILYIGKANWEGGEYYNGLIDNYVIAGYAMTADEVKDLVENGIGDVPDPTPTPDPKPTPDPTPTPDPKPTPEPGKELLYAINCGDIDPTTLSEGDVWGAYNSVTDQFYGKDMKTGKMWGVVDTAAPNASYPDLLTGEMTWPAENINATDASSKSETYRYAKDQPVVNSETDGVVYKFELAAGQTYDLELGFFVDSSWTNASNPRTMRLELNGVVVNENFAASNNSSRPYIIETTATADENGFLTIQIGHASNAVWGPVVSYIEIVGEKEVDETLLADFNFDADGEFFDGGNAKATGTYTLVDSADGKALKLDGQGQFLTVTKKDGTSLLTGVEELTVMFKFNPESSATNWAFFAAPNANQQSYRSEHYLGIFDNNGNIGAERYNSNSQDRPANPSSSVGYGNWYNVAVVFTKAADGASAETILYVNGEEAARQNSIVDIKDLLGANSILYIGKSTWEGGEYATALIDNYKIYSRVLTEEEIAFAAANGVDKSALEEALANAVPEADEEKYTPGTWAAYAEALAAAKEVAANVDAKQSAVNEAASALTSAQNKLVLKADMTELAALVKEAKAINTTGKDAELVEDLEKEIADAEKVLANADARQAAVDSALKQLQKAVEAIKEEPIPTPTPTPTPVPLPYVDVAEADWFYEAVAYTFYENVMTGMDPTHFGPYNQLSRAQFALILYRVQGEPEFETEKSFADIAGDEWYGPAVLWAAEAGIVNGYENGCFGPADNITREQMAVMMYRYADYLEEDTTNDGDFSNFKDAESVSEFAEEAMKWAVAKQIITGKEEGTKIDPQGETARAEAAAIIQRFMEK